MDIFNLVNNIFSSLFPVATSSTSATPSQPSKPETAPSDRDQEIATQEEQPVAPSQADKDIKAETVLSELDQEIALLEEHMGALDNRTLTITLQELNAIIPRKRVRIDAYAKLTRHLKATRNATLVITSRKSHSQ